MSLTSDEAIEMVKSVSRIGVREGRLAALREVRDRVKDRIRRCYQSDGEYELRGVLNSIDALIKREEEG